MEKRNSMGYTKQEMETIFHNNQDKSVLKELRSLPSDAFWATSKRTSKIKVCVVCKESDHMKKVIDTEYGVTDDRYSFCYKCRPILDEDGPEYGQVNFSKRNGKYIITDSGT